MSDYEYNRVFLEAKSRGLSEVGALVQATYKQGLINREELPTPIAHLNGFSVQFPTDWTIPENKFDQVVF